MTPTTYVIVLLLAFVAYKLRQLVLPPSNFPKNIPTIPFYVAFVPILTGMDQEQIFNRYFREKTEKYGAVNVYFASRWNVLVTRPKYVSQIFKQNDVFEKSGNIEKIPHAVMSQYLGDNIISAGNRNWKKYRKIMQDPILFPDLDPIDGNVESLISSIKENLAKSKTVSVNPLIQRYSLANIGDCVLGCNLKEPMEGVAVDTRVNYLKGQIFKPFFMNFPSLDKLPIPSRNVARQAVKDFKRILCAKIVANSTEANASRLGPQLARNFEEGVLAEQQFKDNAIIALIAGHENPQILLTSVLYMLAKNPSAQTKLRKELASAQDKEASPFLNSVVYEALRMYPPLGQLLNRKTTQGVFIDGQIYVPPGAYVGVNSFITQRDGSYWHEPDRFHPERWGTSEQEISQNYIMAKSRCQLTAFHGRNRACLGEKFALTEIRRALIPIVENFSFTLDPSWRERITPMGPIWPVQLALQIEKVGRRKK